MLNMKETFKNIRFMYKYGREYRKALLFETIGSLLGIFIGIIVPIISAKMLVDLTTNKWEQLLIMTTIVLIINLIDGLKTVLIRKNTQKFTVGVTHKLQSQLGKEILKISQYDIDNNSTGMFVQRMTSDASELSNMFTVGFGRLVGILTSVGTFISVFIINKTVFFFYLVCAILLTYFHLIKSSKVKRKNREKRKADEKVTSLTSELIRGIRDIKMLNAKASFFKKLDSSIDELNDKYLEARNIDINYNLLIETLISIANFLLIAIFVYLIKLDMLSVPMAVALYSYRDRLLTNFMERISQLLEEITRFNLSFERVSAILGNDKYSKEKFGTKEIKKVKGNFEFKNVTFSYTDGLKVLDNISFKVDANTTIGFVGESGSGKTTIFNLICKLYNADSGEILIDNYNINDLTEKSIRGNITIIGQNPYVFNMSIVDNMKLVKDNVSLKEIKEACKLACLDEFIESLPEKYNTVIGEGGVTLSGGQKQRLAIARALIQKTEIILFDEATSALDNETQRKIQEAIDNLKSEYTIMIIAHRFSTILNCDKIFFIKDGKVVDSGTHNKLLKSCKDYKKLYDSEIKKTI